MPAGRPRKNPIDLTRETPKKADIYEDEPIEDVKPIKKKKVIVKDVQCKKKEEKEDEDSQTVDFYSSMYLSTSNNSKHIKVCNDKQKMIKTISLIIEYEDGHKKTEVINYV